MTRFPYIGSDTRTYTQYLDHAAVLIPATEKAPAVIGTRTLVAEPGESYEVAVCPMYLTADKNGKVTSSLPVPPGDGAWGEALKDIKEADAKPAAPKSSKGGGE